MRGVRGFMWFVRCSGVCGVQGLQGFRVLFGLGLGKLGKS